MATLSLFSLASLQNRNPMFYHHRHQQQRQLLFVSHLKKKNSGFVCFACSIKQTRVRKRVKSNEELRSEILEFVASAGLPPGHVPSMKELSAHERVDLANVVRRRGYKFIRDLLANSEDCNELTSPSGVSLEDSLTEGQDEEALDSTEPPSSTEMYSTATDASVSLDQRTHNFTEEVDEECGGVIENESSLSAVSRMEDSTSNSSEREADNVLVAEDAPLTDDHCTSQDLNYTKNVVESVATESLSGENAENFQNQQIDDMAENRSGRADDSVVEADDKDGMLSLSSSASSIEEKTARFIQNGYLDTVDDGMLEPVSDDEYNIPNESCPEETKVSAETIKGGEYSHGGQRSVSMAPNGSAVAYEEVTYATEANNSQRNSDHQYGNAELDKDSHAETMKRENQVEITRLRFMLRQKELELSRLKEQIEKEKLSLSVLQRKAETEIQKAQMLVLQKDVELQEAEESLSGLQEVEIEYCGDGNVVEVTGSFNGWEHRVGLELEASKSTGKQKCWSTLLWLYPGTYEIKFIVDGQWITDPQRDSVTRGHITNNILKVD